MSYTEAQYWKLITALIILSVCIGAWLYRKLIRPLLSGLWRKR